MTWEDIMKNKKSMKDFVVDVVRNAEHYLDEYTNQYNIEDSEEYYFELREILEKIFLDLASDYIEENPDL